MYDLVETKREFNILGFRTAFEFARDSKFEFSGERHDFWEIVLVTEGTAETTEDENVYLLHKNNLVIHAPMEFHTIRSALGTEPHGFIISFDTNGHLPEKLKSGVFCLDEGEKDSYIALCRRVIDYREAEVHEPYEGQELADLLSAFLIRLGREKAIDKPIFSAGASEYRRLVSDMTQRVCENLSLADFAAANSISVSYIKLLFQKYASISPKSYFAQLRAKHALHLLSKGYSVAEVAEEMNFSSPNYFAVFFRKQFGCTPSEYKKRMMQQ